MNKNIMMNLALAMGLSGLAACSQAGKSPAAITQEAGMQALFDAVARNDVATIQAAVSTAGTLSATNERGETLLMNAVYAQRPQIVALLIEAGADVNAQDERQNSPFLYAGAEGDIATVRLALTHGADFTVTNRYGGTALIPAAEKGHLAMVTLLANTPGYPIDHVNSLGWTALLEAIILGDGGQTQTQIVAALIEAGADVGIADAKGVTALQHAKRKGFVEIIQLLAAATLG